MQRAVRIGEIVHLESVDQLVDLILAREKGRHDDDCPEVRWDAVPKLELRQRARADELGHRAVHERHGEVGRRKEEEECEGDCPRQADARRTELPERKRDQHAARDGEGEHIAGVRRGDVRAKQPAHRRDAAAEIRLEAGPPLRDQVVAGVALTIFRGAVGASTRPLGAPHGLRAHLELRAPGPPRELLDRVAVAVARLEVHRGELRATAQGLVD